MSNPSSGRPISQEIISPLYVIIRLLPLPHEIAPRVIGDTIFESCNRLSKCLRVGIIPSGKDFVARIFEREAISAGSKFVKVCSFSLPQLFHVNKWNNVRRNISVRLIYNHFLLSLDFLLKYYYKNYSLRFEYIPRLTRK